MNELEQKFQGQIDFIKFDLTLAEGNCEYQRHMWSEGTIPAMLYIDKNGKQVEASETFLEKPQLEQKLQNLLSAQ